MSLKFVNDPNQVPAHTVQFVHKKIQNVAWLSFVVGRREKKKRERFQKPPKILSGKPALRSFARGK